MSWRNDGTTQTVVWIASGVLYAVHEEQLAEHGGLAGLRDANALESAMARPAQLGTLWRARHGGAGCCLRVRHCA